mmetsp:Transcript_29766/g.46716  ORF Transcript_29766/g.46716 Transcript_29766/m.46716 type:complete len:109 (+) Transcript_29766:1-327(+)
MDKLKPDSTVLEKLEQVQTRIEDAENRMADETVQQEEEAANDDLMNLYMKQLQGGQDQSVAQSEGAAAGEAESPSAGSVEEDIVYDDSIAEEFSADFDVGGDSNPDDW